MGKVKDPKKLAWFLIMLIIRIAAVFGVIGLIAAGIWGVLYLLLY